MKETLLDAKEGLLMRTPLIVRAEFLITVTTIYIWAAHIQSFFPKAEDDFFDTIFPIIYMIMTLVPLIHMLLWRSASIKVDEGYNGANMNSVLMGFFLMGAALVAAIFIVILVFNLVVIITEFRNGGELSETILRIIELTLLAVGYLYHLFYTNKQNTAFLIERKKG